MAALRGANVEVAVGVRVEQHPVAAAAEEERRDRVRPAGLRRPNDRVRAQEQLVATLCRPAVELDAAAEETPC